MVQWLEQLFCFDKWTMKIADMSMKDQKVRLEKQERPNNTNWIKAV